MPTTIQINPTPDDVDCVVIGAGVVGLAIARELVADGREVIIIEREAQFGSVTSARNSEVIHAGIYYPEGSLKARLSVEGRERLYRFCEQFGVAHKRCGKLIVATQAQLSELESIDRHARNNGVENLQALDARALRTLEPALAGAGALLSPSTGIIDSHALMLTLLGLAEADGATLVCQTEVVRLEPTAAGILVSTGGADATVLHARTVINAAGLNSPDIAANTTGLAATHVPTPHYARGNYFVLEGPNPFARLIYPVPEPGGLGIHLTLDLAGRARFGPDVEWLDAPDQSVNAARVDTFYERIRSYWPALPDGALAPGYAGVRPKISGPGEPSADFRIDGPETHGIEGLVNLFGIESPGLTASLAIASHVARMPSILA